MSIFTNGAKYKLIKQGEMAVRLDDVPPREFYRLQALRDIPLHNVKAGDMGGYVTHKNTLNHNGSCWIGGNAQVMGQNVVINGDAYIGGDAVLSNNFLNNQLIVIDNAKIFDRASVLVILNNSGRYPTKNVIISGNAKIYGDATIHNASKISDDVEIYGSAEVKPDTSLLGKSKIYGRATVKKNAVVYDSIACDHVMVPPYGNISNLIVDKEGIRINQEASIFAAFNNFETSTPIEPLQTVVVDRSETVQMFEELLSNISAYETDIVKIIKYPVMTDRTDDYTMEMTVAMNNAKRLSSKPSSDEFLNAVMNLEKKFLAAESNALKIASTSLSDEDRRKTEKAKDLLAIAANEGSSENEKKVSFKQAFKQLEGVIAVPEVAMDTFRVKIGLKELEM